MTEPDPITYGVPVRIIGAAPTDSTLATAIAGASPKTIADLYTILSSSGGIKVAMAPTDATLATAIAGASPKTLADLYTILGSSGGIKVATLPDAANAVLTAVEDNATYSHYLAIKSQVLAEIEDQTTHYIGTKDVTGMLRFPAPVTVTIPSGATGLSAAVDLSAAKFMGIIMPATWVTAVLTFQVCDTIGGTFTDLYDDSGSEVSVTVAQGKAYTFTNAMWKLAPWRYMKFRSGTTGTPVDQTASRAITVVLKQ